MYVSKIKKFLTIDDAFLPGSIEATRAQLINGFSLFGFITLFGLGLVNIFGDDLVLGLIESSLGLMLVLGIVWLHRSKHLAIMAGVIVVIQYLPLLVLLFRGGIGGTGIFWFFTLPPVVFLLHGRRVGIRLMAIIFSQVILLAVLAQYLFINGLFYDSVVIRQMLVCLAIISGLVYLYQGIIDENIALTHEKNIALEDEVDKTNALTVDLKKRTNDLHKFERAVENASDSITMTDTKGKVVYANAALYTQSGYVKEDVIGMVNWSWEDKQLSTEFKGLLKKVASTKKSVQEEVEHHSKTGQAYTTVLSVSPVFDEKSGEVLLYVAIERDVTEERRVERSKNEFVALASHQLRTPLSAMRWNAELLLSEHVNPESEEYKTVKEMQASIERMIVLVNAFLDVSQVEMHTFNLDPAEISVEEMVAGLVNEVTPLAKEKDISLSFATDLVKKTVFHDLNALNVIVNNILANAIHYTAVGGSIELNIRTSMRKFYISVKDTGYGIPEQDKEYIFTKMYRGTNVRMKYTDGNGIGLYLTQRLVDLLGGTIGFISTEGVGTEFTVKLPLTYKR